jgi:hypothetical protein
MTFIQLSAENIPVPDPKACFPPACWYNGSKKTTLIIDIQQWNEVPQTPGWEGSAALKAEAKPVTDLHLEDPKSGAVPQL